MHEFFGRATGILTVIEYLERLGNKFGLPYFTEPVDRKSAGSEQRNWEEDSILIISGEVPFSPEAAGKTKITDF